MFHVEGVEQFRPQALENDPLLRADVKEAVRGASQLTACSV